MSENTETTNTNEESTCGRGFKQGNEYQAEIGYSIYKDTPKAVFAALLVSVMVNLQGIEFSDLDAAILDEWETLHAQGIIPQKPPKQ